jgi:hypothetical protein
MLKFLTVGILMLSVQASANDFQERKAKWSANLENRINELQKTKSCVDGSVDHDSLKSCQKERKGSLKEARAERKERFKNKKKKSHNPVTKN